MTVHYNNSPNAYNRQSSHEGLTYSVTRTSDHCRQKLDFFLTLASLSTLKFFYKLDGFGKAWK